MLNVAIVDDEAPARKRLRKLLQPLVDAGRVQVTAEASDGVEALGMLQQQAVDLLLLDIRMPALNGFDTLERISPDKRPLIVFTTAYDAYALKAFEANAIDYLLKPVSAERLEGAVERAEKAHRIPDGRKLDDARISRLLDWMDTQAETEPLPQRKPQEYLKQISVPYRDRILIIPVGKVISAEIHEGVTRLYVQDEEHPGNASKPRLKHHIVTHTLDQLEQNLDPEQFMRVHRSAIVQVELIQEMISWFSGRYKLILAGGHEVIASRERSKVLKDRLMI